MLAEKEKVTPQEIKVSYWGDEIQDDVQLSVYKMKEGETLNLETNRSLKQVKTGNEGGTELASEAQPIKLKLVRAEGDPLEVEVNPTDTVAQARLKIEEAHKIPNSAILLKLNGQMLFPIKRIQDYGMENGSEVELSVDQRMLEIAKENLEEEAKNAKRQQEALGEKINCKVYLSTGEKIAFKIYDEKTVKDFIKVIKDQEEIDDPFDLIVRGKVCEESTKLVQYDIKSDTPVIAKMKGEIHLQLKRAFSNQNTDVAIKPTKTV
mmetsp:Transcript_12746/g.10892  ORF Transcript_12746/g.10892 Transcript_12746/m.10892 type:complete len:264 (+) Transcript_12746:121-912(+)